MNATCVDISEVYQSENSFLGMVNEVCQKTSVKQKRSYNTDKNQRK